MKSYVYGYDIRCIDKRPGFYEEEPTTVGLTNRYSVVSHDPLTDEEVIDIVITDITIASHCKYKSSFEKRLQRCKNMYEITNIKLLKEYGE